MTEERRAISEVRDIPTEVWIKVLSGIAGLSLVLAGFIGVRALDKLDIIGDTLTGLVIFVKANTSEISNLKETDKEIIIKVDGISRRVYKLEGLK
jgi:hypothetical protein